MRTNVQSATAFRGFGTPQGLAVTEAMMDELAVALDVPLETLRAANMVAENSVTHFGQTLTHVNAERCVTRLKERVNYARMLGEVAEFNRYVSTVPTAPHLQ